MRDLFRNSNITLKDKKFAKKSLSVHVLGLPSTIAKVLNPKELSIWNGMFFQDEGGWQQFRAKGLVRI